MFLFKVCFSYLNNAGSSPWSWGPVGRARPQAEAEAALPTGTAPEYAAAPPLSLWDQKHLLTTSIQPEAKSPRPGISAPVHAAHAQIGAGWTRASRRIPMGSREGGGSP